MTLGFVDDGEIIGTLAALQIGAAWMDSVEATSPITAVGLLLVMIFLTTLEAPSGVPASSWTSTTSVWPLTPPAALIAFIASLTPLSVEWPNVDLSPVSDPYSPIVMVFDAPPDGVLSPPGVSVLLAQPPTASAKAAAEQRHAKKRTEAQRIGISQVSFKFSWRVREVGAALPGSR